MALEQAARAAGYDKNPEVQKAFAPIRREILAGAYWDDVAARTPAPSAAEVEAWYRSHPGDYAVKASRQCAHVVVASEEEARKAKGRIQGGATFEAMAREVSLDRQTGEHGGDLGTVSDEKLTHMESALSKAILTLPAGAVSDPVKSNQGWHLFTCQPVPAHQVPLAEAQDRIAASIRAERISAAVNARLAELKKAAPAKQTKAGKAI
jgi:foldase protein PrsA